jgi:hypothetical protein
MQGADGKIRAHDIEKKLNIMAADVFGQGAGAEFFDYLRSITTNVASGPEVNTNALLHLEGQRYIVGLISQRIQLGHKEKRNVTREGQG